MFNISDKVVYPLHGAGTIKSIEKKIVAKNIKEYYSLYIPFRKLEILIPVENCQDLGLRAIVSAEKILEIEAVLVLKDSNSENNWNKRYRENLELLKTGDPLLAAKVVRDLCRLDNKKPLATGEKRMLNNAKSILASEIALVNGKSEEETLLWIKEKVLDEIVI